VIQGGSSPSGARMRSAVSKSGDNSSLAGREEGMEKPKRARRRKSDTAKADLKPPVCSQYCVDREINEVRSSLPRRPIRRCGVLQS
jgi:hypothetical protein